MDTLSTMTLLSILLYHIRQIMSREWKLLYYRSEGNFTISEMWIYLKKQSTQNLDANVKATNRFH